MRHVHTSGNAGAGITERARPDMRNDRIPRIDIRTPKTIQQLARILNLDIGEVSRLAEGVLKIDRKRARDRKLMLSIEQCEQLTATILRAATGAFGTTPDGPTGPASRRKRRAQPPHHDGRMVFRKDSPANRVDLTYPEMRHQLRVHPDISERLRGWTHLYRRLGIVLQHLAAHGRSTVVKGCANENKGWRRSPLGGNNGMQYYLWWTPASSPRAQGLDLPENAIVVRDVRHHDDHSRLETGPLGDYLHLATSDELIEDIAGSPWTREQIDFVDDQTPVRVIIGRPGSGKTTVLWKAVEARTDERVLYLTWSSALTRHAEERFRSFAPVGVDIVARDFTTFLGELRRADVPRQTLGESLKKFRNALTRLGRDAGPWARRPQALHAELRGFFFGRAAPGNTRAAGDGAIARLHDDAYAELRGDYEGVGEKAAKALLRVAQPLLRDRHRLTDIFPELAAATEAVDRLRQDQIPEGFESFDRIVVDEVQDLTLLESAVVVELCRAIGRARGYSPWLLMAGDAGQTVRPTSFEWAPLNDLLSRRMRRPAEFHLEEHLRCPSRIAEVVERASDHYTVVEKEARPTKQHRQKSAEHVDAQLIHVHVPEAAEAVRLLEGLDETDDVAVLSPRDEAPPWVPMELRPMVLTPAEAKGLEYQSVCVLDPGPVLSSLSPEERAYGIGIELDQPATRTAIDHLRVTLSRATETLVFIDVMGSETDLRLSGALLGDPAPYSPDDLLDHLSHADASPEERVLARTSDARRLIDAAPHRAWQRACQAVRLLGDRELPNGVADQAVRDDARRALLETAARLMVDGVPEGVQRNEITHMGYQAIAGLEPGPPTPGGTGEKQDERPHQPTLSGLEPGAAAEPRGGEPPQPGALTHMLRKQHRQALEELDYWTANRNEFPPFALLEAVRRLRTLETDGRSWLQPALLSAAQTLRDGLTAGTADPGTALLFAKPDPGLVETWLRITGYAGDVQARARALTAKAFDTVLSSGGHDEAAAERRSRLRDAESLLDKMQPDPVRLGRLREAQERPWEAAEAYEHANRPKDVLRVLRNASAWERSVDLAEGEIRADLEWLLKLKVLVAERPPGQNRRLRNGERDRLEKLLDEIQQRPPRKAAATAT